MLRKFVTCSLLGQFLSNNSFESWLLLTFIVCLSWFFILWVINMSTFQIPYSCRDCEGYIIPFITWKNIKYFHYYSWSFLTVVFINFEAQAYEEPNLYSCLCPRPTSILHRRTNALCWFYIFELVIFLAEQVIELLSSWLSHASVASSEWYMWL